MEEKKEKEGEITKKISTQEKKIDISVEGIFKNDRNSQIVFGKLVDNNSLLKRCDKTSLAWAIITAKQLRLDIDPIRATGQAYILPYRSRLGSYIAQLQIGYKGLIKIAYDSGYFKFIKVIEVKEGEEDKVIEFVKSTDDDVDFALDTLQAGKITEYEKRRKKETIGYLAFAKLKSGVKVAKFMSLAECKDWARKYSDTYKRNGRYTIDNDKMYAKTVLKNLLRSESIPPTTSLSLLESQDADTNVSAGAKV